MVIKILSQNIKFQHNPSHSIFFIWTMIILNNPYFILDYVTQCYHLLPTNVRAVEYLQSTIAMFPWRP